MMKNFKLIILIAFAAIYQPLWGMLEEINRAINNNNFLYVKNYIQNPETDLLEYGQTILDQLGLRLKQEKFAETCYCPKIKDLSKCIARKKLVSENVDEDVKCLCDLQKKLNQQIKISKNVKYLIDFIKNRLYQEVWNTFEAENYDRLEKLISNSGTDVHSKNESNQTIRQAIEERISQDESLHSILDPIINIIELREQIEIK